MSFKLVRPAEEYAEQVMQYRQEMLDNGDSLDGCAGLEDVKSYSQWIRFEKRLKKKYGSEYVPSDVFLFVRESDDRVVGIIDYRHPLSEYLKEYGGHIGYSIRPGERCKGYATKMLRQMLDYCRDAGEEWVLVTCLRSNKASQKVIQNNGGVLEDERVRYPELGDDGVIRRYLITL